MDSTQPDAVFFLDTSFLHRHEIPAEVFDALLSRKVIITPPIWGELGDWIENPFANARFRDALVDAMKNGSPSVIFANPLDWSDDIRESIRYYIFLLLARKLVGPSLRKGYTNKDGRELSPQELIAVIQSRVGDRGTVLAKKGLAEYAKPNLSADEDLVVTAVAYAITTGHETSILTRDRDPLEQFRKFIYLVDTHYRSLLIAESFVDTPENLIKSEGIVDGPYDCVEAGDRCVLNLPRRFTDWVVPKNAQSVLVCCRRFAGDDTRMKIARLTFKAHREMSRLLQIKGKTGGRNYAFPDGRNCHLTISPPFHPWMAGKAIVGRDRNIEFGPFRGPIVDFEYALQEVQRWRSAIVDESALTTAGITPGIRLADFFLSHRLRFSAEPEWRSLAWTELSKAIRFFDAADIFFVDRGVMPRLKRDFRRILMERGISWSVAIRDSTLAADTSEDLTDDERNMLGKMNAFDVRQHAPYDYGFGHYLALLALRRQVGEVIRRRVSKEYGRDCKYGEIDAIAEHYGGVRARRLAEQSTLLPRDRLLFVSDELLVCGAIAAVLEGTNVVFITSDPRFLDQFAKLGCLWRTDYVASEFGRQNADDPMASSAYDSRRSLEEPNGTALGTAIYRRLRRGWRKDVLPSNPYLINLHCWLLGRDNGDSVRFAALTFCAERGMHNLLRVKGLTGGRNVERLDGRNLRISLCGDGDEEAVVSIWNDRMIPIGAADFPEDTRLDLRIAALAAIDISRIHANNEQITMPWYEATP
jgi:hypothetical protein